MYDDKGFGGANSLAILQQYVPDEEYTLTAINGEHGETRLARYLREVKTTNGISDWPNDSNPDPSPWSQNKSAMATKSIGNTVIDKVGAVANLSHHRLFVLAARTQQSLDGNIQALDVYMRNAIYDPNFLNNLAYTLERRSVFPWRAVITAANQRDLFDSLQNHHFIKGQAVGQPKIAFVRTVPPELVGHLSDRI